MISIKVISSFLKKKTSTALENFVKLLNFLFFCHNSPHFQSLHVHVVKCIQFHACRTRFKGSFGRPLPSWRLGVSLFHFRWSWMKRRGENPAWRPYCIIFLDRGFQEERPPHLMRFHLPSQDGTESLVELS